MAVTVVLTGQFTLSTPNTETYDTGTSTGQATDVLVGGLRRPKIQSELDAKAPTARGTVTASSSISTPNTETYDTGTTTGQATDVLVGGVKHATQLGYQVDASDAPLPILSPPSVVGSASFGSPNLNALRASALIASASFGTPVLQGQIVPSAVVSTAAFGSSLIGAAGVFAPSIVGSAILTDQARIGSDNQIFPPSIVGTAKLGKPRINPASILPPSIVGTVSFGSGAVLSGIKQTSSVGGSVSFGGPTLSSGISVQAGGLVSKAAFGRPLLLAAAPPNSPPKLYHFLIDGVERSSVWFEPAGIQFSLALNGGGSGRFVILDPAEQFVPSVGQQVDLIIEGVPLWSGIIATVSEIATEMQAGTVYEVTANDLGAELLKRRIVYGSVENENAGFVVSSLTNRFLQDSEGIQYLGGLEGPVGDRVIQPTTALEMYNRMASEGGSDWYMDQYRQVRFSDRANPKSVTGLPVKTSFAQTDPELIAKSIKVRRSAGDYRNVTFVQLSRADPTFTEIADPAIDLSVSPSNAIFNTAWPIKLKPVLKVYDDADIDDPGTSSYTIPAEQIFEFTQSAPAEWEAFYYDGLHFITLQRARVDAALGAPVKALEVTYQIADGASPFVVAEDEVGIAARAAAEGGKSSGRIEAIENETDVEDRALAVEIGKALNARYAESNDIPAQVEFAYWASKATGWVHPGMAVTVNFTRPTIAATVYVESVQCEESDSSLSRSSPELKLTVSGTTAASSSRRRIQRVRMNRAKMAIPIIFVIAKSHSGSVAGDGLATGTDITKAPWIIRQKGLLADATLFFETGPVGGPATVTIERSTDKGATWAALKSITIAAGLRGPETVIVDQEVEAGHLLRLSAVVDAGVTNDIRDGTLGIRQFV